MTSGNLKPTFLPDTWISKIYYPLINISRAVKFVNNQILVVNRLQLFKCVYVYHNQLRNVPKVFKIYYFELFLIIFECHQYVNK